MNNRFKALIGSKFSEYIIACNDNDEKYQGCESLIGNIFYVKTQTYELCKKAVKLNAMPLKYVKNQTPELCILALKDNGYAYPLAYVHKQTEEICIAAMKEDGRYLDFVEKQTDEICLAAVMQNGFAIRHVINQTPEICRAAVKKDLASFAYIRDLTLQTAIMYEFNIL